MYTPLKGILVPSTEVSEAVSFGGTHKVRKVDYHSRQVADSKALLEIKDIEKLYNHVSASKGRIPVSGTPRLHAVCEPPVEKASAD